MFEDVFLIVPMVRWLEKSDINSNGNKIEKKIHWYKCVHFDGKNCGIYPFRPRMCREYPYGKRCQYEGCAFKNKKPKDDD
jgi:Fe-S-cluster containining protein